MRRALIVVVVGACGFRSTTGMQLDAGGDVGTVDGAGDSSSDGAALTCFERWMQGPMLAPAQPVAGVSTSVAESDPFLSKDELTIYMTIASDVRVAKRPAITAAFSTPVLDVGLSAMNVNDYKATVTEDGLTAFVSTRSGGAETRVRRGTRPTTSAQFTLDNMYVGMINDGRDQWDPHVSADGLRLYLSPGNGTAQHVAVATRTSLDSAFGPSQTIAALASTVKDNDHSFTLDERVVVFSSERSGMWQLWYAVRSRPNDPFSVPALLQGARVNDDGAHLSADGCRLYVVSDRAGNADIYVADVM